MSYFNDIFPKYKNKDEEVELTAKEKKEVEKFFCEVDKFKDAFDKLRRRPVIANPDRIRDMKIAYEILTRIMHGDGLKITYEIGTIMKTFGSISVSGKTIEFTNMEAFREVVKLAGNFDTYVMASNKVMMEFGFSGIADRL